MAREDVVSQWVPTQQFAVISTPRRRKLSAKYVGNWQGSGDNRLQFVDYLEIDNRGNKGATIFYALNGLTASSTLASGAAENAVFQSRLPPDSIDRLFVRATSISVVSTGNATTIYLTAGRF